jgi:hypothetical protein
MTVRLSGRQSNKNDIKKSIQMFPRGRRVPDRIARITITYVISAYHH